LRLAGSLKLGRVPATGIMRTLQVGDRPTQLALALAEFGRIEKTLHTLNYIDDENRRRATLLQLNRGEGRHSLARDVFHGKRGELRQRYREGQEDQLGALGLVVNIIVLWNTIYIDAALTQLRQEGYPIRDEDVARLSPFVHERTWPNPLVGRDARAAVVCTVPITREHRAAVLLTFRMGTTIGSASAVIVTVAERESHRRRCVFSAGRSTLAPWSSW
jgi:hypothetical protein